MKSGPLIVNEIKIHENPSYNPRIAEIARLEAQMMECEENGLYNKGLKLAIDSIARFPENPSLTYSWTAIFHFFLGENEKSIQVLAEGLTKGAVWSPLFLEEGFQKLKDHPRFLEILELIRKNFGNYKYLNQAELLVRTPKSYFTSKQYPLLLVFHGRFDNNAANDLRWRNIVEQNQIFLALLQSSQMQSGNHFVWDDENKSFEDLKRALAILVGRYPIDASKIILAGVSQGSELALVAIFSGLVAASKFISVIPSFGSFSYQLADENSLRNKKEKFRGCFIAGEQDPRFSRTKTFFELLRENGMHSRLFSYPELGHQIPDDFNRILPKAVDFVLKEKL
ncbi:MAG: alpha/beta hydrolase [Candidatus Hodarchaeota archaeon]